MGGDGSVTNNANRLLVSMLKIAASNNNHHQQQQQQQQNNSLISVHVNEHQNYEHLLSSQAKEQLIAAGHSTELNSTLSNSLSISTWATEALLPIGQQANELVSITGKQAEAQAEAAPSSTWSLLMSALFLNKQPEDELQVNWANFILALILIMLMLTTAIGNLFVIFAILIERNLRTIGNYLVLSLAIADLLVACLVMPLAGIYQILDSWTLGVLLCDIWTSADVFCCTASILHLLAIALDRYWAVTRVDYIRCQRNERRILFMIFFVWMAACIISLAPVFGWKDAQFESRITKEKECLISQDVGYQIFATCTTFYFPLTLTLVFYWKIYQELAYNSAEAACKKEEPICLLNCAKCRRSQWLAAGASEGAAPNNVHKQQIGGRLSISAASSCVPCKRQDKSMLNNGPIGCVRRARRCSGADLERQQDEEIYESEEADEEEDEEHAEEEVEAEEEEENSCASSTMSICVSQRDSSGASAGQRLNLAHLIDERGLASGEPTNQRRTNQFACANQANDHCNSIGNIRAGNSCNVHCCPTCCSHASQETSQSELTTTTTTTTATAMMMLMMRQQAQAASQLQPAGRSEEAPAKCAANETMAERAATNTSQPKAQRAPEQTDDNDSKDPNEARRRPRWTGDVGLDKPAVVSLKEHRVATSAQEKRSGDAGGLLWLLALLWRRLRRASRGETCATCKCRALEQRTRTSDGSTKCMVDQDPESRGGGAGLAAAAVSTAEIAISTTALVSPASSSQPQLATSSQLASSGLQSKAMLAQAALEGVESKRERKAAKTLAIITGVFVMCWLPFFIMAITMPLLKLKPHKYLFAFLLWLGYANSMLNPIIYTIFSPDFRKAFKRLLCAIDQRRQQQQQQQQNINNGNSNAGSSAKTRRQLQHQSTASDKSSCWRAFFIARASEGSQFAALPGSLKQAQNQAKAPQQMANKKLLVQADGKGGFYSQTTGALQPQRNNSPATARLHLYNNF